MNKKVIIKRITHIKKTSDLELIKLELYGIVVDLILSKEEFPLNVNIADFLKELKISYKPYLLKSRTTMLGKILRNIEKADESQIQLYINTLEKKLEMKENSSSNEQQTKKKKKKKSNYMSDIMNKYRRGSNEEL
jgi:hypothetical protein